MYKIYCFDDRVELYLNDEFIAEGQKFVDFQKIIPSNSSIKVIGL